MALAIRMVGAAVIPEAVVVIPVAGVATLVAVIQAAEGWAIRAAVEWVAWGAWVVEWAAAGAAEWASSKVRK